MLSCIGNVSALEYKDSVNVEKKKFLNVMKPYNSTFVGLPLLIGGIAFKGFDGNLRNSQLEFASKHNDKVSDYIRFAPAALMLGLKLSGVQSRSSWTRMIVSDALSGAIMLGGVELLKRTTKESRPNGEDNRSFPSGHTATAFMMATMLHKEYGNVSPWYSIGGYAVATYTGMSRILSNKHWISDVVTGAGIGILSTEIGYFLTDLIFKERGLNKQFFDKIEIRNNSYLGINFGLNFVDNEFKYNNLNLKLLNGTSVGINGAYYFNKFFGLGCATNFDTFTIKANDNYQNKSLQRLNFSLGPETIYGITNQLALSAHLFGGYGYNLSCSIYDYRIGDCGNMQLNTGLSVVLYPNDNTSFRIAGNYNLCGTPVKDVSKTLSYFTIGTGMTIQF